MSRTTRLVLVFGIAASLLLSGCATTSKAASGLDSWTFAPSGSMPMLDAEHPDGSVPRSSLAKSRSTSAVPFFDESSRSDRVRTPTPAPTRETATDDLPF